MTSQQITVDESLAYACDPARARKWERKQVSTLCSRVRLMNALPSAGQIAICEARVARDVELEHLRTGQACECTCLAHVAERVTDTPCGSRTPYAYRWVDRAHLEAEEAPWSFSRRRPGARYGDAWSALEKLRAARARQALKFQTRDRMFTPND